MRSKRMFVQRGADERSTDYSEQVLTWPGPAAAYHDRIVVRRAYQGHLEFVRRRVVVTDRRDSNAVARGQFDGQFAEPCSGEVLEVILIARKVFHRRSDVISRPRFPRTTPRRGRLRPPARPVPLEYSIEGLTCAVAGLAVLVSRTDLAKDAELLVLRHENAVLRRSCACSCWSTRCSSRR
jgi:hypothetical protein